ncbi:MFS transporter [Streptomyces sp. NBC_00121]|uniref:MFS transporter n=1 Tax=unclassified Streptomyces TaxID=2593676 RepID=UPI0028C49B05|nr:MULTISPECIES: MFS transporter [unclassified Streptomyces]WNO64481.1 MFS transporter [Streptomyces sp. AM2-3-1]WSC69051.1 MFS transporter [Streptomyces sp. NBC_01760]WTE59469.1 MFS transporter [Streptomyces sp. NBC_01617]
MTAADTAPRQTESLTGHSSGARAWIVTGLLVVFMMVNFADKSVFGLAADEIRADMRLSATEFGLANSAFFLLFSVAAAAVGLLSDRVRPKWLLLTMAVLWSVAQTPAALGGGLAVLIGSRVLLGAAEGPAFPVAQQAALSWFPNHRRNLPGALVTLGVTLGVITAAPGLTWVIHHHGWRAALWVVAAAGALWALLWAVLGADGTYRTDAPEAPSVESAAKPTYRRILGSRTWIGTTAAYFTSYWCVALMLVWMPSYLHNGLGHSAAASGKLVALPWAMGALVLLGQAALTGRLMRRGVSSRWARGRVGAGLLLLGAAACLALPLVDGAGAKTALLVVGLGLGGAFPTVAVTTVAELAPPARRGGALGTMNATVTTAGLIAPAVVGQLVDSRGVAGYQTAVLLSGVLLLLGALAAFTLIDPARDAARPDA